MDKSEKETTKTKWSIASIKENKLAFTRLCLVLLVLVSIPIYDALRIRYIQNANEDCYQLITGDTYETNVENQEFSTKIEACSANMKSISIWTCEQGLSDVGSAEITYKIIDSDNVQIYENTAPIADCLIDEEERVSLDVSEAFFERGREYTLVTYVNASVPIVFTFDRVGIVNTQVFENDWKNVQYGLLVLLNVIVLLALFAVILIFDHAKDPSRAYAWCFLFFFLAIGIFSRLSNAPFSREDEFRHFARVYDLSLGGTAGYWGVPSENTFGNVSRAEDGKAALIKIPADISELRLMSKCGNYLDCFYHSEVNPDFSMAKLFLHLEKPEKTGMVEVSECAVTGKSYDCYFGQILMVRLAELLGLRSCYYYYLACFGQLLTVSIILFFALRLLGNKQEIIWLCGFISPFVMMSASCNPDGLMIAEMILGLSIVCHFRMTGKSLLGLRETPLVLLYVLLAFLVLHVKPPYGLVCLAFVFLFKKENFEFLVKNCDKAQWKKRMLWIVGTLVILFGLFIFYVFGIRKGEPVLSLVHIFVSQEHLDYMLANPEYIAHLFYDKFRVLLYETKDCMAGSYFVPYYFFIFAVLVFSKKELSVGAKLWLSVVTVWLILMIVLAGYTMTPPDYGQIWGVTWRYILPIVPVAAYIFPFGNEKTDAVVQYLYRPVLMGFVLSMCTFYIT